MDTCENTLNARGIKPVHALEKACKHRTIVCQNRVVAVLEQTGLIDLDLFAEDTATIDSAAHHPIDAAVTMVGAAVAVLAESTRELGDHDDDGIAPTRRTNFLGESGKRATEFAEPIRKISRRRALVDVRIPAADIDEAEVELLAHQPADPARRQFKAARRHRTAIGRGHEARSIIARA